MKVYICYELCTLHHMYYTVQNILYILYFTYCTMCKLLLLGQHLHTTLCKMCKLDTLCILYTIHKTISALTRTILQIIDYTNNYPYCIIAYYTLHSILDALYCAYITVYKLHIHYHAYCTVHDMKLHHTCFFSMSNCTYYTVFSYVHYIILHFLYMHTVHTRLEMRAILDTPTVQTLQNTFHYTHHTSLAACVVQCVQSCKECILAAEPHV